MAGRVSVACPACSSKLNLSDPNKLGKKIKCPKCGEAFVAEAPDDDFDDEPAPVRRTRNSKSRPGGKKSSKSKAAEASPLPWIIGGVAALLLIGLGLFFSGIFGRKAPDPAPVVAQQAAPVQVAAPPMSDVERILGLRWMPPEIELIVHLKVSDLWTAPLLKSFTENVPATSDIQNALKLTPADFESVTAGTSGSSGSEGIVVLRGFGTPTPQMATKSLVVIRTKKALSQGDIVSAGHFNPVEHNGKSYLESKDVPDLCGWIAESTTLLIGNSVEVKAAMDRGETVIPRKELMILDPAPNFVLIFAPMNPEVLSESINGFYRTNKPTRIEELQKEMKSSMTSIGLGLNIRGGFDLHNAWGFKSSESAQAVKSTIEAGFTELRPQLEPVKSIIGPEVTECAEQFLSQLKVNEKNQVVNISATIPDSSVDKIPASLYALREWAMMGFGTEVSPAGSVPSQP